MALTLSILDQSSVTTDRGPDQAIRETLALAKLADEWGYYRYWLAEHHNSAAHAGSAPEILISAIAATTKRIRVGSAGVMLPHYAALKVAEQFRVLEAIAPGRIDLGIGRAPGSDGRTAYALNPNAGTAADNFPQQIRDLQGWLGEGLPVDHPFRAVLASPAVPTRPELWILGSSDYGAQVAAYFGLPYCYAHFITDGAGSEQAMELYHQGYRPSAANPKPNAALAVFALTAATEERAQHLFSSRALARLWRDQGRFLPLPSPEAAEAHPFSEPERAYIERLRRSALVGTPAQVRARIEALAAAHGAQEIAILSPCFDQAARAESYRLLAEEFARETPALRVA